MDWYQRLNICLKRREWTRAELAQRSGVPFRDLVRYRGKSPNDAILERIATALEVDPLWLREGTESPERAKTYERPNEGGEKSAFMLAVQAADRWETELFGEANIIAHTTLVGHLYRYIVDNDIQTLDELGTTAKPPGW